MDPENCNICLIDEPDVVLPNCKHKLWKCCDEKVNACPYCRTEIVKVNNIMKQLIEDIMACITVTL